MDIVTSFPGVLAAVLAVAIGGLLGGMARWALSHKPGGLRGTLVANTLACFILAFAVASMISTSMPALGLGVMFFAGALSTWSTLAKEIGGLAKAHDYSGAAGLTLLHLGAGVIAAILGVAVA